MRRARQLLLHTSAMTATSLLMRSIALAFQVYVAGKIGAAGIGLFQLVMSVYTLATTVAVSGVRLAATRLIAQQVGRRDDAAIRRATGCAMGYSAFFGTAALLLLYYLAPEVSSWVGDDRIVLSLRVLAFALPFVAGSGAMGGYFIAMHQSVKMSLVQLSEQLVRIGCTILALLRLGGYGLEYACGALTLGMLASEIFSFLALLLLLLAGLPRREGRCRTPMLPSLLRITVPLSLSSYARSALSTAQHLLVPRGLRLFGGGAQAALAAYGVIQGMSLPILLFPAALIGVIAELIVPELTEAQVQGRLRGLGYMLERLYRLGLFFSMAVAGACFFFAQPLGDLIYSEPAAGQYIRLLAPLVPVMYMDTLVDGMLKGVGEYRANMRYNIIDAATGLLLVWLLLPRYGVAGYLFSIFATELLNFALSAARLTRVTVFRLQPLCWLLTAVAAVAGFGILRLLFGGLLSHASQPLSLALLVLLYLGCYTVSLLLCRALRREELFWLFSLLRGQKFPQTKNEEIERN